MFKKSLIIGAVLLGVGFGANANEVIDNSDLHNAFLEGSTWRMKTNGSCHTLEDEKERLYASLDTIARYFLEERVNWQTDTPYLTELDEMAMQQYVPFNFFCDLNEQPIESQNKNFKIAINESFAYAQYILQNRK